MTGANRVLRWWMLFVVTLLGFTGIYQAQELLEWEPHGCWFSTNSDNVRCGWVTVPETPQEPDGRTIELAVAVFDGGRDDVAPLIYLHGGPGAQIMPYADIYANALRSLWQGRDFIVFEQRGIGVNQPALNCNAYNDALYELIPLNFSDEDWLQIVGKALLDCRDNYEAQGISLRHYNTRNSAYDVVAIMDALGYEQTHLLGISYGTRLALTVADIAPARIASMVLDSVVAPSADGSAEFAYNYQRALDAFFKACGDDTSCDTQHPNLEQRFDTIITAHNERPVRHRTFDTATGESLIVNVNGDLLLEIMFNLLYDTSIYGQLPAQIERLETGNYDYFVGNFLRDLNSITNDISIGMYYAVMCQDEINFADVGLAEATHVNLSPNMLAFAGDITLDTRFCQQYAPSQNNVANDAIVSDVPTLLLAGDYDPITPPAWAELTAKTLPQSQVFTFASSSHAVLFADGCASQMASAFIENPTQALDAGCVTTTFDHFP
jgi:pimeloyl-ACP methyl ester carboxylesterase